MGAMMKAGVIGHPVSHSKSPLIHGYWIKQHGLDACYKPIDVAPERLREEIRALADAGYAGFNVTIPHKLAIMKLCDEVDDIAQAIGAVNTVVIEDGKQKGTNTDAYGFIENIKHAAPGFDFKGGPALVLGAGGAARAVVHGLLEQGVPRISITNRTKDKALKILGMNPVKIEVVEWAARHEAVANAALLVNTTALGMKGQMPLDMNLDRLEKSALVADIVYAPLMTPLLRNAQARGNPIVTGIGMLLHQAKGGFEKWFGVKPEVTRELEEMVLR